MLASPIVCQSMQGCPQEAHTRGPSDLLSSSRATSSPENALLRKPFPATTRLSVQT